MAESHSETDFSTAFQAYSKLIAEVNVLEIEMRHEIEKGIYLEQVLTALALTAINSQEAAI